MMAFAVARRAALRSSPPSFARSVHTLLVANRGEIALRVIRAASELDIKTVAIHEPADAGALHVAAADTSLQIASYLDASGIVGAAMGSGCDAIHPGYGFLSESHDFARLCEDESLTFVGPTAKTIEQLGDKVAARALSQSLGVPVAARH